MIRAQDAIFTARALIGTPYADLDCINLIKRVIRSAPGGVPWYTTAGTNALWASANASAKYRDLVWRQDGIAGAAAGMLAFKRHGGDVHHVGIVTGQGTVIHSSSARGCVVETDLDESWHLLARHRYIETAQEGENMAGNAGETDVLYTAQVNTQRDPLNVRDTPDADGRIIGKLLPGTIVSVLAAPRAGWLFVRHIDLCGYAASAYLVRREDAQEEAPQTAQEAQPYTTIIREDGATIRLAGIWRVAED